jgi:hypothetical protein
MHRAALLSTAIAITVSLTLIAFGVDGSVRPVALSQINGAPYVVTATQHEVDAAIPGTPRHAVASWFHAIQIGNHRALKRLTAPAELDRIGERHLYSAAAVIASALGRPLIESVRAYPGDVRAVRALILSYGNAGVKSAQARTFTTVRLRGGAWRVADASYVIEASNALRRDAPK